MHRTHTLTYMYNNNDNSSNTEGTTGILLKETMSCHPWWEAPGGTGVDHDSDRTTGFKLRIHGDECGRYFTPYAPVYTGNYTSYTNFKLPMCIFSLRTEFLKTKSKRTEKRNCKMEYLNRRFCFQAGSTHPHRTNPNRMFKAIATPK